MPGFTSVTCSNNPGFFKLINYVNTRVLTVFAKVKPNLAEKLQQGQLQKETKDPKQSHSQHPLLFVLQVY